LTRSSHVAASGCVAWVQDDRMELSQSLSRSSTPSRAELSQDHASRTIDPPHQPPLIDGVHSRGRDAARNGRKCLVRPSLRTPVVIASLLRQRGADFRLIDQTARQRHSQRDRSPRRRALPAHVDRLLQHDAHAGRRHGRDGRPQAPLRRAARLLRPHASALCRVDGACAEVDAMVGGEPEEAVLALASLESLDKRPGSRRDGAPRRQVVPGKERAVFSALRRCRSPRGISAAPPLPPPAGRQAVHARRDKPRCRTPATSASCDSPRHKFRERDPSCSLTRSRAARGVRDRVLLPVGRHGHPEHQELLALRDELVARTWHRWFANARADNLVDPVYVDRLKGPDAGCCRSVSNRVR